MSAEIKNTSTTTTTGQQSSTAGAQIIQRPTSNTSTERALKEGNI